VPLSFKRLLRPSGRWLAGLPILALVIVVVGAAVFFSVYGSVRRDVMRGLERDLGTRADVRAASLDLWVADRFADARIIASFPSVLELLAAPRGPLARERARHVAEVLGSFARASGYARAIVVDRDGRVAARSPGPWNPDSARDIALAGALDVVQQRARLIRHAHGAQDAAFAVSVRLAGRSVGAVVLEEDPGAWLFPFLAGPFGTTTTAEALLVETVRDSVCFLSPTRLTPPPSTGCLPLSDTTLAATAAARGQEGFGAFHDYRGAPTFASIRRLELVPWYLVFKVDRDEVLAPHRAAVRRAAVAWGAVLLALATAALALWWGARREQQAALAHLHQEGEARLRSILEAAATPIFSVDRDLRYVAFNMAHAEAMRALYGSEIRPGQALGEAITAPRDRALVDELSLRVLAGEALTTEAVFGSVPGQQRWFEVHATPIRDVTGAVAGATVITYDQSARRAAEEDLRAANARLRALIDTSPAPIIAVNPAGVVQDWNPAAERTFGWTAAEAVGRPNPIIPPEAEDGFRRVLERTAAGEVIVALPVRRRRRDGTLLDMLVSTAAVRDTAGRVVAIVGVLQDVTEQRRMEQKLRAFFEGGVIGVLLGDIHGHIHEANDTFLRLVGYERADVEAGRLQWNALTPSEYLSADAARLVEGGTRGYCTPYEKEFVRKDGTRVAVLVGFVLLGEDRHEMVAFILDISDRKRAEQAQASLATAFDHMDEIAILTDTDGTITYVNPAFERITGYAAADAIGQTPRLLKSGQQPESFYRDLWATIRRGEVWKGQLANRRRDGSVYTAEVSIAPILDASGRVTHFLGLQRDVTGVRILADQLRQAQKMEAIGHLTGGVAHDFNNLLSVVLANAALLEPAIHPDASAREHLADLVQAARQGSQMVRRLLAFGRRERLALRAVDLGHVIRGYAEVLRRLLPEHIEIRTLVEAGLPAVMADAAIVEQMVLNLATNARDAMPAGGTLAMSVRTATLPGEGEGTSEAEPLGPGRYVVVEVSDTGAGMDAEVLSHVFEPFFTTKPVGEGTGLGLPMVHGLIHQHGGDIRIWSTPARGTTVRLYFPAAEGAVVREETAAGVRVPGRGSETILVVEDQAPLRRAVQRSLERHGYQVLTAGDGEDGWTVWTANRERIALVITDVVMPKLSGPELFRRVRDAGGTVPIVLTTGHAERQVGALGDLARDAPTLEKPWEIADLLVLVRRLLDEGARSDRAR
jgi:PAS domain S-box-containing protein